MLMLGLYTAPPSTGGALVLDISDATDCQIERNEHGDARLTAQVRRSFTEALRLYDQAGMRWAGLCADGHIIWEGRLEDPGLFVGNGGSGLKIQALGAWRALSDAPYTALWSTTQLKDLMPVNQSVAAAYVPEKWELTTSNNIIAMSPKKNENFGNVTDIGALTIETPSGGSRPFTGVQCAIEFKAPVNWKLDLLVYNRDFTGGVNLYTLVGTGAVLSRAVHFSFSAKDRVLVQVYNNTGGNVLKATDTTVDYCKITGLRLVTTTTNRVNTTMTVARAAGVNVTCTIGSTANMYVGQQLIINGTGNPSEIVTVLSIGSSTTFNATFVGGYNIGSTVQAHVVYADEVAKDMVAVIAALNSGQLSNSTALIQSPALDLTDETYEDATMADVLTRLAGLGDTQTPPRRWEVGAGNSRQLFFRPRGSAAQAWHADVPGLDLNRSIEDLANSVYAIYSDANGRTLRTAAASNAASITRYGLTRGVGVKADTTSSVQATAIRDAALADRADPLPQASFSFTAIYDSVGSRRDLWEPQAGDTITLRNLPLGISPTLDRIRTFRISRVTYDPIARTLSVEPEAPATTLETVLTQQRRDAPLAQIDTRHYERWR